MTHIVIAQCTDEKQSGRHQAQDLYTPSDLFTAQRRYAEAYADEWYILSAKHGLIRPWERIYSYDMEISEQHSEPWQERLDERVGEWLTGDDVTVEVIASGDYLERLEWYLEHYGVDYTVPFDGQRYGTRVRNMIEEARKVENESIESYA